MNQSKLKEKTCSRRKAREIECERVIIASISVYRKGYGSIAHEAKPNGLLTRGTWPVALEGEGSNCFSTTQLVGQKKQ